MIEKLRHNQLYCHEYPWEHFFLFFFVFFLYFKKNKKKSILFKE